MQLTDRSRPVVAADNVQTDLLATPGFDPKTQPSSGSTAAPPAASRTPGPLVLTHTHAHTQWRVIAEEFGALLMTDFVDIVFKVRGGSGLLCAHRSLVAAAWPVLQEELRRLDMPPKRELRTEALRWTKEAALSAKGHAAAAAAAGGGAPPRRTASSEHHAAAGQQPQPPQQEANGAAATDVPLARSTSAELPTARSPPPPPSPQAGEPLEVSAAMPGVFDLTSKVWGSYAIVRALLCHLYSWPMSIHERELPLLKTAAQSLGCTEVAKLCEDYRPTPMQRLTPPEGGGGVVKSSSIASSGTFSTVTAPAGEAAGIPRRLSTSGLDSQSREEFRRLTLDKDGDKDKEKEKSSSTKAEEAVKAPVVLDGKVPKKEAQQPPVVCKPFGERSFVLSDTAAGRRQSSFVSVEGGACAKEHTGGVRRVLSEIKRNMAESSRIIQDHSFKELYEMVPGEQGILGEGINGMVRMARHKKHGREVAVKRISCVNLSEQRRQMLVSEVRIFLQVSHRNIVQLYEVYESEVDQAVLLVMELCTGKELFERLAESQWYSEFDAARVAKQMLDAVAYLHSQNVCHRDLKLENWLYENPSHTARLKLCDFGFGQIVEPSVQLTATLGSLFYLAPEVLEGSYGLPCDMWSIGVIVYMLLSGVPPFDGKTDQDVMTKIKAGRFVSTGKRWDGISDPAKHFVRSILRKDPYERLAAQEAIQHAWLKMDSIIPNPFSFPKGTPDSELELPIDRGVVRDMGKFVRNNGITRAALGMLVRLNTSIGDREEDVRVLQERFQAHDENNTGKIDAEAFVEVLKQTLQSSSADEKQYFERISVAMPVDAAEGETRLALGSKPKARRREVNYQEFISLAKTKRMATDAAAIREAFRAFDELGDGYIEEKEMHNLLGEEFKKTIDDYVDQHGKDLIDYADFADTLSEALVINKKGDKSKGPEEADGTPRISREGGQSREAVQGFTVAAVPQGGDVAESASSPSCAEEVCQSPKALSAKSDVVWSTPATTSKEKAGGDVPVEGAEMTQRMHSPRDGAEDEDEEADADAQSDEEQLVNVVDDSPTHETDKERRDRDADETVDMFDAEKVLPKAKRTEAKKVSEQKPGGPRFQSFSLSLAGSSEHDGCFEASFGINRVESMPSDVYSLRQLPGFHARILRPFYTARPVSNVVMGLVRGTSLYARQSVQAKLATIIHTSFGWFFIMPNPKYHSTVDARRGLIAKETGKFRFVAWWIHPRFVPQLRQWFEKLTQTGEQERKEEQRREARAQREARARGCESQAGESTGKSGAPTMEPPPPSASTEIASHSSNNTNTKITPPAHLGPEAAAPSREVRLKEAPGGTANKAGGDSKAKDEDMGSPGDFRFSDVPKPDGYLHTYRDLASREHVSMISQMYEGTNRFLRSLFDDKFLAESTVSAGFHYPVRSQYATLHMQVRVNSGSVCRSDGRGMEVTSLIEHLKRDRQVFERDEETLKYQVTENVKVSLLAAANEFEEQNPGLSAIRQTTPLHYELGVTKRDAADDDGLTNGEPEQGHAGAAGTVAAAGGASGVATGSSASAPSQVPPAKVPKALPVAGSTASLLINLQPAVGSSFHRLTYDCRDRAAALYGKDSTHLYPLHISATGFLEMSEGLVEALLRLLREALSQEFAKCDRIKVGKVICTPTGYVLYDIDAPAISGFARRLAEQGSWDLGVTIRPKAGNHISLACNRPDEGVRDLIRKVYEPTGEDSCEAELAEELRASCHSATFDVVVSRLLSRGVFEDFEQTGPHNFVEVARIPVCTDPAGKPL
eukprot:TRINITY_DN23838_c0_g1_i1.p1 TRINITY_DN23838_c0_g1~~TRINITY_DN23838_c0_g1_i1.p1  ORF type:complete len:1778 (-),score=399.41 TRINITY_DN23838_c0_g1_i1:81-5414(-)